VIELLDFKLRGGHEAPVAAARVTAVARGHLDETTATDLAAVVAELVAWIATRVPRNQALRLELSITSTLVRVSVTAPHEKPERLRPSSHESLREALPVTADVASRHGLETARRTRVWAELDRQLQPEG
jgi:hypothetical protein